MMIRRRQKIIVIYLSGIVLATFIVLGFVDVQTSTDHLQGNDVIPRRALKFSQGLPTITVKTTPTYKSLLTSDQLCYGKGVKPKFPRLKDKPLPHLDFKKEKFQFLHNFKNPCFYRNVTFYNKTLVNRPIHTLRCLPYFFIVGMPKSGTTDIWHGLELHPGVAVKQHMKEPMYFTRRRFPQANWTLDQYLDHFHLATEAIASTPSPDRWFDNKLYFYQITGEGTVDVSHDNNQWRLVPGNDDCNEPRVLNAHFIHHLNPNMKLIFMMRNPVDRVFSDYLYESQFFGYKKTVKDFHHAVLESINNHMTCRQNFTERGCAYNQTLESFKARLRVGMYHIFLEDWLRVFPADQILIIRFEDFIKRRLMYLKKVFAFLGLRPITLKEENIHKKRSIPNTRSKKDKKIGDMMRKTRSILKEFYKPFNKRLTKLLNDVRYMWDS